MIEGNFFKKQIKKWDRDYKIDVTACWKIKPTYNLTNASGSFFAFISELKQKFFEEMQSIDILDEDTQNRKIIC